MSTIDWVRRTNHLLATTVSYGATMPAPIQAVWDKTQAKVATLDQLEALATAQHVSDVIAEALDAGTPIAQHPKVTEAAAARALLATGQLSEWKTDAQADLLAAVRQHVDALIKAWRKVFDPAAATLNAAAKTLNGMDLDDPEAILQAGPEQATAWREAKQALPVIHRATQLMTTLMQLDVLKGDRSDHVLLIADPTLEQWPDATPSDVWHMVSAGIPLRLPTRAEFTTARDAMNAAWREANPPNPAGQYGHAGLPV